jgi:hypothetical protein
MLLAIQLSCDDNCRLRQRWNKKCSVGKGQIKKKKKKKKKKIGGKKLIFEGLLLVFWPHFVFGQNHLSVKMLYTGISLFRVCKSEEFKFPVSRPDDRAILSGHPSVHYSIRPDDVSYRPDARQTRIICPDEVFIPSEPHTVSRSFCANLHPSGRFSNMSGLLSALDQFLISFQVLRNGRSINRPDDVVSRPDARLRKARIAIQI